MSGSSEPNPDERPADRADQRIAAPPKSIPVRGRLLGLDFGTRRIGIAVSDDEQRIASPLENLHAGRVPSWMRVHLKNVAGEYRVVGLVVGLPLHMGGEEGQKAREARRFGAWAASATALPLAFWDERLTSAIGRGVSRSRPS